MLLAAIVPGRTTTLGIWSVVFGLASGPCVLSRLLLLDPPRREDDHATGCQVLDNYRREIVLLVFHSARIISPLTSTAGGLPYLATLPIVSK
jgi:hypothetical protein